MKHVVLIGMMGVGKTTIGRLLAERLKHAFVDSDALIEQKEGRAISEIFATSGEPYFRQRELETIRKIVDGTEPVVLSIGGGAFMNPVTRFLLREKAVTIYLRAKVETLVSRVGTGATRPLLTQGAHAAVPLEVRLKNLLAERDPVYAQANFPIDTDNQSAHETVQALIGCLGR